MAYAPTNSMTESISKPQTLNPEPKTERLGIVSYTNVAPLHWQLMPWEHAEFVRGVPTELNQMLLEGFIDLTLISSIEFIRHRDKLKALPDFSIATLGPVQSVMLFHWEPWEKLNGKKIAVTTDSATSVELLKILLRETNISANFVPMKPDLDEMLESCDAALLH
jgi:chorismate dehydratase